MGDAQTIQAAGASVSLTVDPKGMDAGFGAAEKKAQDFLSKMTALQNRARAAAKAGATAEAADLMAGAKGLEAQWKSAQRNLDIARGYAAGEGGGGAGMGGLIETGHLLSAGMKVHGFIRAAQVAVGLIKTSILAFQGDWNELDKAVKDTPFLGEGAKLAEGLASVIPGSMAYRAARVEKLRPGAEFAEMARKLRRQAELAIMSPEARRIATIQDKLDDELLGIRAAAINAGEGRFVWGQGSVFSPAAQAAMESARRISRAEELQGQSFTSESFTPASASFAGGETPAGDSPTQKAILNELRRMNEGMKMN